MTYRQESTMRSCTYRNGGRDRRRGVRDFYATLVLQRRTRIYARDHLGQGQWRESAAHYRCLVPLRHTLEKTWCCTCIT